MSEFDPDKYLAKIESKPKSEFDPDTYLAKIESEPKEITKLDSLGKGIQQGTAFGFADEFGGAVDAGMDTGHNLLNLLGLAGPSNSRVAKELYDSGTRGDIGPQSTLDMYRQGRDQVRSQMDAAQSANPGSFLAGNLAGGLLVPMGKVGQLAGTAAKEAGLATKIGTGLLNGVVPGAIAGLGSSTADLTEGNIGDVALDTAKGAGIGAGIGGTIPAIGAGLNSLANSSLSSYIPKSIKNAYELGTQGVDKKVDGFYKQSSKELNDHVDSIIKPISEKVKQQVTKNSDELAGLESQLSTANMLSDDANVASVERQNSQIAKQTSEIDQKIANLQTEQQKALELGKARQLVQNSDEVKAVNRETVETAKRMQQHVFDVKKVLGKQFDELDSAAAATGITPDNNEIIANLREKIATMSGLPESEANSIMKKIEPSLGDKSIQGYRNVKGVFANYFEHANPVVRRSMKEASATLKNNYSNDLRAAGYNELADNMAQTNKRWGSAMALEEDFLDNVRPDRLTGEFNADPAIRAISNFKEATPGQMAKSGKLVDLMNILDPVDSPKLMNQVDELADRALLAKGAKANVIEKPMGPVSDRAIVDQMGNINNNIPVLPNPEVSRLESLLAQTKSTKPQPIDKLGNPRISQLESQIAQVKAQDPTKINGLDLNTGNEVALKKELLNLVPKYGMEADDISDNKLNGIIDFLGKSEKKKSIPEIQKRMSEISKLIELRNSSSSEQGLPTSVGEMIKYTLGGAVTGANKVGLIKNKISSSVSDVKDVGTKGIAFLAKANPEAMQSVIQKLSSAGEQGAEYAKILADASQKNGVSKNAMIFSLMQNPTFRELIHSTNSIPANAGDESNK